MTLLSPIKKVYVDTPSGQLHYRHATPANLNGEVIVFLHMSASSSACYEQLMKHYASKGYTCYAPDMPGFGHSFDPQPGDVQAIQEQGTRWYVDMFVAAFRALGIASSPPATAKRFHILGHHTGGSLATEMAVVHPDAGIASVAIVGPSVISAADRARMKVRFFTPFNRPVADGTHLHKTWDYLRASIGIDAGGQHDVAMHQQEALDHARAWQGRSQVYGAIWAQDKERYFGAIGVPMLAMCARDDVLWHYFGNVRALRPDIRTAEIQGANFGPSKDAEGIIRVYTSFLKEVAQGGEIKPLVKIS